MDCQYTVTINPLTQHHLQHIVLGEGYPQTDGLDRELDPAQRIVISWAKTCFRGELIIVQCRHKETTRFGNFGGRSLIEVSPPP